MATLTAIKFPTADGAQQMERTLLAWQKEDVITVQDAGIVIWPQGAKQPKTGQLYSLARAGSISGAFWGTLFGLIFWVPSSEMASRGAKGALMAKFNGYGISANFIKLTQEKVTEGTSALFLLTADAVFDRVVAAMQAQTFEVISLNLSEVEEAALRAAFGED
jgi:uncharacterized membrane protein